MNKHYLNLDFGKVQMYEYSKHEAEGYEVYISSTNNKSYRKYFNKGVFGVLQSVGIFDNQNKGKDLSITLKDGDDLFFVKFTLNDQRGNFDNRYVEPLITLLPNMEVGTAYRIYPWMMESDTAKNKKGNFYKNYGVSIKTANLDDYTVDKVGIEKAYRKCKRDEKFDAKIHLPALDFQDEFGTFKPTVESVGALKSFLYKLLTTELDRLGYKDNQSKNTPTNATPPQEKPKQNQAVSKKEAVAVEVNEDDDLPF